MELLLIVGLFAGGFAAGFVDSIAGGGGLISVPVLLFAGLPPQVALGTNKFQASFGSVSAATNYARKGAVDLRKCKDAVLFTFLGAATGATVIQFVSGAFLEKVIPWLLLLVLVYMAVSPRLGAVERKPRMNARLFHVVFGLVLGFYDGFFGPGTGSFWTAAYLILMGLDMTRAVGHTKVVNATSNVVALAVFVVAGNVLYTYGLVMAAGQALGANLGSSLAMRRGTGFIRPIFMAVVLATIAKMMWPG